MSKKELETIRSCKVLLNRQMGRARKVRDMLEAILEDHHDMNCMYLGRHNEQPALQELLAQLVCSFQHMR